MTPQLHALLDLYRDVSVTNHITFPGVEEARAMQRDPTYVPLGSRPGDAKIKKGRSKAREPLTPPS